ncbi:Neuropeptide Y receptor type 2 [Trichoplax sp. H2]|nr:Neuropeptide Y receptor type 2 [Trichoplax sp. H2]|eukprot:RDD42517.1 Neuropeptide Y receptor type 2 [Trichoplax sp. H2]
MVVHCSDCNISIQNSSHLKYKLMFRYSYIAAIPVFIIGIIANIILFYLIACGKYFHKVTYQLISIAVISDLISLTTSIIVFAIYATNNVEYSLGSILCKLLLFITYCCYGVSMTTLCMISIDRYFAVTKPLSSLRYRQKRRTIYFGQTIGCLLAIGVSVPVLIYNNVHFDETQFCDLPNIKRSVSTYLLCNVCIFYILPLAIIMVNYIKIIRFQYSYVRPGEPNYQGYDEYQRKRKKFIRILIIITSIYFFLTWPFFAVIAGIAISSKSIKEIREMGCGYYLILYASYLSTFAINIINPFIYFRFDYNIKRNLVYQVRRWLRY